MQGMNVSWARIDWRMKWNVDNWRWEFHSRNACKQEWLNKGINDELLEKNVTMNLMSEFFKIKVKSRRFERMIYQGYLGEWGKNFSSVTAQSQAGVKSLYRITQ